MPHLETGQEISNKNKSVDYENRTDMRLWTKEKVDMAIVYISLF